MDRKKYQSQFQLFYNLHEDKAELRKILKAFVDKALVTVSMDEIFTYENKKKKPYLWVVARRIYCYLVSELELGTWEAVYNDFEAEITQFFKHKSQAESAFKLKDVKGDVMREALSRVEQQLRNPFAVTEFKKFTRHLATARRTKKDREQKAKERNIKPIGYVPGAKYRTDCGYIDVEGNIILYPPLDSRWMY